MDKRVEPAAALSALLEEARQTLSGGDAASAERQAKAVSAIVRAERDVAEFMAAPRPPSQEEDEEALRAELRRRLAVYVAAESADAGDEPLQPLGAAGAAE